MEWNIKKIEDELIDQSVKHDLGHFWVSAETKNSDGVTLSVEIDGWIDEEDGDVLISGCDIRAFDSDDNDLNVDGIRIAKGRIEREATSEIRQAIRDARDMEETESYLSWGGWFV